MRCLPASPNPQAASVLVLQPCRCLTSVCGGKATVGDATSGLAGGQLLPEERQRRGLSQELAPCCGTNQPLLTGGGLGNLSFPFCAPSEHRFKAKCSETVKDRLWLRARRALISNFIASLGWFILPFGQDSSWYHKEQGPKVCAWDSAASPQEYLAVLGHI